MTPSGIQAYLASNLDFTGPLIRERLSLQGAEVVLVPTATYAEGRPLNPDQQEAYEALGARVHVVDIATLDGVNAAYAAIRSADVVQLCGGNTFALLDAIHRSGFAKALEWRGLRRTLTVIGESAGAIVLGADIAHVAPLDDPSVAPGLSTTAGLGWSNIRLVPHYQAEAWGFGARIDAWLASDPQRGAYTLLRDDEALFLDGAHSARLSIG